MPGSSDDSDAMGDRPVEQRQRVGLVVVGRREDLLDLGGLEAHGTTLDAWYDRVKRPLPWRATRESSSLS